MIRIKVCARLTLAIVALGLTAPSYAENAVWIPARVVSVDYPLLGLQSRTHGTVEVGCDVTADDSVSKAKLLEGSSLLGQAVIDRIGEWRFKSVSEEPPRSPSKVTLTFDFILEGDGVVEHPKSKFIYEYPDRAIIISQPLLHTH